MKGVRGTFAVFDKVLIPHRFPGMLRVFHEKGDRQDKRNGAVHGARPDSIVADRGKPTGRAVTTGCVGCRLNLLSHLCDLAPGIPNKTPEQRRRRGGRFGFRQSPAVNAGRHPSPRKALS